MSDKPLILYTRPAERVARISLNRPEARNAQNLDLLEALDEAFTRAVSDEEVRVIILAGEGPHFSAGHDLRQTLLKEPAERFGRRSPIGNFSAEGGAGYMAREEEVFLAMSRRWRNLTKPTIAEVQGRCIAGGLILAWVCDLIVASDDASFMDPVLAMGVSGVEYFAYPWEFGARKAKEFLFTGDMFDAQEAWRLGMVNHVVPRAELSDFTLALAGRIAGKPAFALKAAKQAVNAAVDAQGQQAAMDAAFQIHHLCHYHNRAMFGDEADPSGMPSITNKA
jgi:enoyl-CoA hydratase